MYPPMVVSEQVVAEQVGDELVLLDLRSENFVALNEVAAVVWRSLEAHGSQERAASDVVSMFGVDRSVATEDVAELIADLVEMGLVERRSVETQGIAAARS